MRVVLSKRKGCYDLLSDPRGVRRREFIALLGGVVAAWPFGACAQQALPVIGFVNSGSAQTQTLMAAAYRKGLLRKSAL